MVIFYTGGKSLMQQWEYQTIVVKIGREKQIEVIQANNKETKRLDSGGMFRDPMYIDLPTFLEQAGRDGWEVVGMSPITHGIPSSGVQVEGKNRVLIILKRPLE